MSKQLKERIELAINGIPAQAADFSTTHEEVIRRLVSISENTDREIGLIVDKLTLAYEEMHRMRARWTVIENLLRNVEEN